MNYLKNILASAIIALFLVSGVAFADSITPHKHFHWTGFYLGPNAGPIWTHSEFTLAPGGDFLLPENFPEDNPLRTEHFDINDTAFTAGMQFGYNYKIRHFLCGLETDFNLTSQEKSHFVQRPLVAPLVDSLRYTVTSKLAWFGTLRSRIGVTYDPVLIYATGGLAYGHFKSNSNIKFSHAGDTYIGARSFTHIGWTVGGGLEFGFLKDWSIKLEYLYLDLGKHSYLDTERTGYPTYTYTTHMENSSHMFHIGVNYNF